jgi:cell division protein FtsQ
MLKKILGLLIVVGLLSYLVYSIVQFAGSSGVRLCSGVQVELIDGEERAYVTTSEVLGLIHLNGLDLEGEPLDEINYRRIEQVVSTLSMIRKVECFSANSGKVVIRIWQNQPVLRIMHETGSYYVDSTGRPIEISYRSVADVLVASGSIRDSVQVSKLYELAMKFRHDPFWNAQIEQVYVEPNGEWTLIPRVGDNEINLGLPVLLDDKLDRLKLFYKKALPKVGWERYASISLKYRNQIVCTIKEK